MIVANHYCRALLLLCPSFCKVLTMPQGAFRTACTAYGGTVTVVDSSCRRKDDAMAASKLGRTAMVGSCTTLKALTHATSMTGTSSLYKMETIISNSLLGALLAYF